MDVSNQNQNQKLISFLKELASKIETNELSAPKLEKVGTFFMSYKFMESNDLDKTDFIKFLVLGWYIYNILKQDDYNDDDLD